MEHAQHVEHGVGPRPRGAEHKVDEAAWGLFFVWLGVAILVDIGWGLALFGIGVITLGAQIARRRFGLAVEWLWAAVGALFVLGGVWDFMGMQLSMMPLVLIAAGVLFFVSALRKSSP
jgi:hypothetical protein